MAVSNKQLLAITLGLAGLGLIGIGGLSVVAGPILSYPLAVELPKRVIDPSSTLQEPPARIELRVDSSNQVFWNNSPVAVTELQQRMEDEVRADSGNPPELRIAADPASDYEVVGKILAAARMARMKRIGFSQ